MTTSGKYLAIYLNDHLAGATAGVELAKRAAGDDHEGVVASLAEEIEQDRDALLDVMQRLSVDASHVKPAAAWLGEKLGRLKLNGELLDDSPLSPLVEFEALSLGVEGKVSLWRALQHTVGEDPRMQGRDLPALVARATEQREQLEALRLEAAKGALSG